MSVASLGELVSVQTGKLDANASSPEGAYPFFTCAREPLRIADWKYDLDAILVAGNGDLNVKHYKGKFDAYQRTYILSPKDEKRVDTRYLYHFMDTYLETLRAQSIGGIIKYIKLGMLTEAPIPLPPLEEQKRIAAILDQADELRRKRQCAIDQLNKLGQAIFFEMFGDLLLSTDSSTALGDVCDVRDGTHDSPKYIDDGFPLLTSKNFSGGQIDYTGASMISKTDFIQINKRSKVDKGDIVMPMIGTIGSPVIVDFEPDFAIKNVALIKFQNSKMNSEFIRQVLDGPLFQSHVANKGRGGTQKFISLGDIRGFQIPLPCIDQQDIFSERMRVLRKQKVRHFEAKSRSELLFSSLQHRAFQGEL